MEVNSGQCNGHSQEKRVKSGFGQEIVRIYDWCPVWKVYLDVLEEGIPITQEKPRSQGKQERKHSDALHRKITDWIRINLEGVVNR